MNFKNHRFSRAARFGGAALAGLGVAAIAAPAWAATDVETAFIFNTLSFLMHGFLVMWMAAGFAMLEAGLVRTKNTSMQCLKNIAIYSVAGILYYLIGYNLMYMDVSGFIGSISIWSAADPSITADGFVGEEAGYAAGSDWFFQMVFVAATASIVSGTVAERVKLWPFLIFTVVLTGVIYPIQGAWSWGGGWLSEAGFSDFAGSSIVHSVGGWAALAGAIVIGARKGKFVDGKVNPIPGANLPLATLGTFILWMGWFGFNGGSQLAMGSVGDVADVSRIFANTNAAAAGGAVVAAILTQLMYRKPDLTMVLNGALAGLVSITAEPLTPSLGAATMIGAVGGVIVVFAVPFIDKLRIDDVVGAIPVHLLAGIWGTMAVPLTNGDASFVTQFIGVISVGAFVTVASAALWLLLKAVVGIRVEEEAEINGLDMSELGMEAYPEFAKG
jgi:Amt family ammonium transporter